MHNGVQARNGDKDDAAARNGAAPDKSGNDDQAAPKAGQGNNKPVSICVKSASGLTDSPG